eukprot:10602652-Alexandrium_andersonii.AAC.1
MFGNASQLTTGERQASHINIGKVRRPDQRSDEQSAARMPCHRHHLDPLAMERSKLYCVD